MQKRNKRKEVRITRRENDTRGTQIIKHKLNKLTQNETKVRISKDKTMEGRKSQKP